MKKLYFFLTLFVALASSNHSQAQTLVQGDIVIIGTSCDTGPVPSVDEFSWMPLVNLTAGTKIYFTDAGYNTVDANWMGAGLTDEILFRYIVPVGGISAGTVMTVTEDSVPTNYTVISGTRFGNDFNGLLTLPNAGDQITVFQSTDDENTPATFGATNCTPIFMVTTSSLSFTALTTNTASVTPSFDLDNVTNLAPGLTAGVNAIAVGTGPIQADETDNARYVGITSGTRAQILAAVSQLSNWSRHDAAFGNDIVTGTTPVGWTTNGVTAFTIASPFAAEAEAVKKSEYTRIPVSQYQVLTFKGKIKNTGAQSVDARLRVKIKDASDTELFTNTSSVVTVANGATSAEVSITGLTSAPAAGTYTVTYDVVSDTGDLLSTTTTTYAVLFTAVEMARDDNAFNSSIGIGAGVGGYLGQTFEVTQNTPLGKVSIQASSSSDSYQMGCAIFKMVGGVPQLLHTVAPQTIPLGLNELWYDYTISPPLQVTAGDVLLVCAQEFENNLALSQSTAIFTPGTAFVYWSTIPTGGWTTIETFGGSFAKPFMIRPFFECALETPTVTAQQSFCQGKLVSDLSATGTNLKWYDQQVGGTALTADTVLQSGSYYVVSSVGSCESARAEVAVTVNPLTSATTTIAACVTYTWSANGTVYTNSGTYTNVNGCHTETLNLTITPITTNTTTVAVCGNYTWSVNGTNYTSSGTYTDVDGCHTETLNLTITPITTNTTTVAVCGNYTWSVNGTNYTSSGTYTDVDGCHTETLNLTITPITTNTTTVSVCGNYTWNVNGTNYTSSGTYTDVDGCHTETLNLTITPITTNTTTVSVCGNYTWSVNGTNYTSSGTYTDVDGCHTETLNLTITPITTNTTTVSVCGNYTWSVNGTNYTSSGTYTDVDGCHTETLNLTITPITTNTTTVSVCGNYTWSVNGTNYTNSGTYTDVDGCHTETLNLTITPITTNTTTVSVCGNYTWSVNGTNYTNSGTYTDVDGCHTETLNLTITPITTNTTTVSVCGNYTWSVNGTNYTSSGTYTDVDGCHTETLNLTITPITTNTTTVAVCGNYTWSVNGTNYTSSGTYTDVDGCHTETLNLTITPITTNTTTVAVCGNYTWSVNGTNYTSSGTYTDVDGCHTETLNLTITPITTNTTTVAVCGNYTWSVNGTNYTNSGTYTDVDGCHTETLNLTITPITTNTTTVAVCGNYTWSVNGTNYTSSGTYTDVDGCHTETLNLTITPITTNTTTVAVCGNYTWSVNGTNYTSSGTYTDVDGCHTETLNLTITPITTNTTTVAVCGNYTWSVNGTNYTSSGTYTDVDGCHTETLNLTITPITTNTTTVAVCGNYTWSVNGTNYTNSGTYTDVDGCHTETLNLTITPETTNTTVVSSCQAYTWTQNGTLYTASGTYTDVDGCNTEILELTITMPQVVSTTTINTCSDYTWASNGTVYTLSGSYSFVDSNCEKHVLNLSINANTGTTVVPTDLSIDEGQPAVFSVTNLYATVIQWQRFEAGQWIDIPEGNGFTGTTTKILTISGSIAATLDGLQVRVALGNPGCDTEYYAATLDVVLGKDDFHKDPLTVYPNPATSQVYVKFNMNTAAEITIFDINGRLMRTQRIQTNTTPIDISQLEAGVYMFRIATEFGTSIRKVIKN